MPRNILSVSFPVFHARRPESGCRLVTCIRRTARCHLGWAVTPKEKKRLILLYVGRKEESKNYSLLLELMQSLEGSSITLVMIGKDIDRKPVEHPNILLRDQVNDDELQWAYRACDIFLFPSLKESFGIVILEAWAAQKKPVIVHRLGARQFSSLIEHNVNGMIYGSAWRVAGGDQPSP